VVIVLAICLGGGTSLLYRHACDNGFINYDDPMYVTQNAHVREGLTARAVAWSFTTPQGGNWHALTWLSLCLDAQLFGPLQPWGYHVTAVLLHALNAAVFFLVFWRMTGALGCSAVVAALFAVHPAHVESVAWISERKDVLSTFFWVLTLAAYALCVEKPSVLRRAAVIVAYALALMAKPMVVTLPILLLLLDYWPLARLRLGWQRLLGEKLPLFALSALICGVTLFAQQAARAGSQASDVTWLQRVENAFGAYGFYIFKTFWPLDLTIPYPSISDRERLARAVLSAILITAVTLLAVKTRRRFPYLLVGWCWYLVTLIPVIGIVRGGAEAGADRYTYVPSIGLFVMIVWGGAELAERWRSHALAVAVAGLAVVLCSLGTWLQIFFWHDSVSLFSHSVALAENNPVAHAQLAGGLWEMALADNRPAERAKDLDDALAHYRRCVELDPSYAAGRFDLGAALCSFGRLDEAKSELTKAIERELRYPDAWFMLGNVLSRQQQWKDAEAAYRNALAQDPGMRAGWESLGRVLGREGKWEATVGCFRQASAQRGGNMLDHVSLAWALMQLGKNQEADEQYAAATAIDSNWTVTIADRAWRLASSRWVIERNGFMAVELARPASARAAAAHVPRNLDILAAAYAEEGNWAEAVATAERARSAAVTSHQEGLASEIAKRCTLYRERQAYRAQEASRGH
jgi:tetratricopeptide (TPR) repeat protein